MMIFNEIKKHNKITKFVFYYLGLRIHELDCNYKF